MSTGYQQERKSIRDNLVSLLTGNTNVGSNVFSSRSTPLFEEETSAINIYTPSDTPQRNKKFDWNYDRHVSVMIEIFVRKTEVILNPGDEADIIAGQVENRILPNVHLQVPPPTVIQLAGGEGTPGAEIVNYFEMGALTTARSVEGLVDTYGVQIECIAEYNYTKKEGTFDAFETANIHYDLKGEQQVVDQAEDEIELPQS